MAKRKNKKLVIIVMGPGGSGKGTQAELLAEKFNFYHLEPSAIIEANLANAKKGDFVIADGKRYYLLDEKKLRESGKLNSSPVINLWMQAKIKELAKEGKGIVTSGYPRDVEQERGAIPIFKKLYGAKNIKVILLEISEKEVMWRSSLRRTCALMRHPILYTKETKNLRKCPFDGSKLLIRKDDTPEVIKTRLKVYKKETLPLIDVFKKEKITVIKINGSPPPAVVFENILNALKL